MADLLVTAIFFALQLVSKLHRDSEQLQLSFNS